MYMNSLVWSRLIVAWCLVSFLGMHSERALGAAAGVAVVATADGPVRGFVSNGMRNYLGIPYAAPPVDLLRWRAPQPPKPWSVVRDASKYAPRCAQVAQLSVFSQDSETEDCLYLNVFTPASISSKSALPVMVWIHGGGFWEGAGSDYDPRLLVDEGNVIVVTINYRLGLFGFLAHESLKDDEAQAWGNYGLMDQIFALKWVAKNIGKFGGDGQNITIFGQSAGGMAVEYLIASPEAHGLFQKAIAQSMAIDEPIPTLAEAKEMATKLSSALGCTGPNTAQCLRSKSVAEIKRVNVIDQQHPGGIYFPMPFVDGKIIPKQPHDVFLTGDFNRVPLINGEVSDEGTFYPAIDELRSGHPMTAADYRSAVTAMYKDGAKTVLHKFPAESFGSPSEAYAAVYIDPMGCRALQWTVRYAAFVPETYVYVFADRSAPNYLPAVSFRYGASHTLELPYLFYNFHGARGTVPALTADQKHLSKKMVQYWTSFARSGRPTISSPPAWPRFDEQQRSLTLNTPNPSVRSHTSQQHKCEFWDTFQP